MGVCLSRGASLSLLIKLTDREIVRMIIAIHMDMIDNALLVGPAFIWMGEENNSPIN